MNLRSYQRTAASEVMKIIRAGGHPLLVSPTGSGKTVIAAEVVKAFPKVLFVSHRRELLAQARRTLGWHVCAHSVQSIARGSKELADLGVYSKTDQSKTRPQAVP